jgi:4'-phosphopantetheinyl transferase EntD
MDIGSVAATAVIARFDQSRFADGLFTTLDVDRQDRLDRAVEKRKAEYLAGRAVAMAALATAGHAPAQIATGPNREPIWPAGVAGSITHSKGRCAAIVTDQPGTLVGIDIEDIATGSSLEAIFKVALQPEETRLIRQSDAQALTATLVFSAKETLYKALFPVVQQFFGFDHAELHGAPSETVLRLRLTKSLNNTVTAGAVFDIGYRQLDRSVITWLITPTPAD